MPLARPNPFADLSEQRALSSEKLAAILTNQQRNIELTRRQAFTLTPDVFRRHLKNKKNLKAQIYGKRNDGTPFTTKDLEKFQNRQNANAKKFGRITKGASLREILQNADQIDLQRSRQIRLVNLLSIEKNTLKFNVGSVTSNTRSYEVLIRIENWEKEKLQGKKNIQQIISQANISLNCQCGRYQYWYRYLASSGGFSIITETGYPKIRNPRLKGSCCKHLLRCIYDLAKHRVTQMRMQTELNRQRREEGFQPEEKFFNKTSNRFSKASVDKAFKTMVETAKTFKPRDLEGDRQKLKNRARETDIPIDIVRKWETTLKISKNLKMPLFQALAVFKKQNGISEKGVRALEKYAKDKGYYNS